LGEKFNLQKAFPALTALRQCGGVSGNGQDFNYFCRMSHFDNIKQTLKSLKPELERKFHVPSIGLFGSVVRDDFSPTKSDIDIIVDFSKPIGIEFVDLADYIESKICRKVDLVSKNGIKKNYFKHIEREIIYV
jgi:predicted nucleotidyltransferase